MFFHTGIQMIIYTIRLILFYVINIANRMRKISLLVVILCYLLIIVHSGSCPTFYSNDLLQSSRNSVMRRSEGSNSVYLYSTPIQFVVASWGVQIAVTTSTIVNYNPLPGGGYNFYIEATPNIVSNSIMYRLTINNDQSWSSMELSYLACSRPDISVGNFEAPVNTWMSSTSNIYNIQTKISRGLPINSYYVAVFISGFTTSAPVFELTINNKAYDAGKRILAVSFYCVGQVSILSITFSYIIYPVFHQNLVFAYNLIPVGDGGAYQLVGPVNFQRKKVVSYNQWVVQNRYLVCRGKSCRSLCILKEDCMDNYGNVWNNQCVFCSLGALFQNGQCERKCGLHQVYSNFGCSCASGFIRIGKQCVNIANKICGLNQIYSIDHHKCICTQNCYDLNGKLNCHQCPIGAIPGANGRFCVCNKSSQFWNSNKNVCQNKCGAQQQWVNNKCMCIASYYWFNQTCRQCPSNSVSNTDRCACVCNSPIAYYFPESNSCIECNSSSFEVLNRDKSGCICTDGYIRSSDNNLCVQSIPQCKSNEVLNTSTNSCNCMTGLVRDTDGSCRQQCGQLQVWNGQFCICQSGAARYGTCRVCPKESLPNNQSTACVCTDGDQIFELIQFICKNCGANSVANSQRSACVCLPDYRLDESQNCVLICKNNEILSNGSCICVNGSIYNEGNVCTMCPEGSQPSADQKICVCGSNTQMFDYHSFVCVQCPNNSQTTAEQSNCQCIDGYHNVSGSCVPICQIHQIQSNGKCICQDGYILNNSICIKCPENSQPSSDLTMCLCAGENQIFNQSSFSCIQCPNNSQVGADKLKCLCILGYHSENDSCVADCSANQVLRDGQCVCVEGSILIGDGVCTMCPQDSQMSQNKKMCICVSNTQIFDLKSFSCVPCQANSIFDVSSLSCMCVSGFTLMNNICQPPCKDPSIFNPSSRSCQCKTGFILNGTTCIPRCPSSQQWNGTACICPEGHALYKSCRLCPNTTLPNAWRTACICLDSGSIFEVKSFSCVGCPMHSSPNFKLEKCVCNKGFSLSKDGCVLNCRGNQVANYTLGICQCQWGYYLPNNSSNCMKICHSNEQYNGTKCICKPGFCHRKNICSSCPKFSISNPFLRDSCICLFPNQIFNRNTFACELCPKHTKLSQNRNECVCLYGYRKQGDICKAICRVNQKYNIRTKKCDCKDGFQRNGTTCLPRCGILSQLIGSNCLCRKGYVKHNGVCKSCPIGMTTNPQRTACVCGTTKKIFNLLTLSCIALPKFAFISIDFSFFICYNGYRKVGNSCVNPCPSGATPNCMGHCVCGGGRMIDSVSNKCVKPVQCPKGSVWNATALQCFCSSSGQYIINGECKTCINGIYSSIQQQCVCNTGFFAIGEVCTACDPNSIYNGTDCVCQPGYYGSRNKCSQCHASCSACKGSGFSQCLACSDISMTVQNGYCIENSTCEHGTFLDQSTDTCQQCIDNCIMCNDFLTCMECSSGFWLQTLQSNVYQCAQICGDGILFVYECDDGNIVSGDGCSNQCNIEAGWTCMNGSSAHKSICNKIGSTAVVIVPIGIANLGNRIIQSVRLSYLPPSLTLNQCGNCYKALIINVPQTNKVKIVTTVQYVQSTQWQFLIEYNFQSFTASPFTSVITLNPALKAYFSDNDLSQQIRHTIDPMYLAKVNQKTTITQITTITVTTKIVSVPTTACNILKLKI